MFEGIEVRISRVAVYRNDGAGSLRLARRCVRYSFEDLRSDQALARHAACRRHAPDGCVGESRRLPLARLPLDAGQRRVDVWPESSDEWSKTTDRLRSAKARAARVRDRIRRLQSFSQYRCDPEAHMWVRLYRQLEGMLGHMT
jgi:hypothetical protein